MVHRMIDSNKFKYELQYNKNQKYYVECGRDISNSPRGNIEDLDPRLYSADQMFWISVGRGSDKSFGNIDDLDPVLYTSDHMGEVSVGRGSNSLWGNIDDLDPTIHDPQMMSYISDQRACDE